MKTTPKSPPKITHAISVNRGVNGGVNGGVNELLVLINKYPGKRTIELAGLLNVPSRTVEKWLAK